MLDFWDCTPCSHVCKRGGTTFEHLNVVDGVRCGVTDVYCGDYDGRRQVKGY